MDANKKEAMLAYLETEIAVWNVIMNNAEHTMLSLKDLFRMTEARFQSSIIHGLIEHHEQQMHLIDARRHRLCDLYDRLANGDATVIDELPDAMFP